MRKMSDITGRLGNQMFQFAYILAQFRNGLIPNVWLQDEAYFAGSEKVVRELYGTDIHPLPLVSIHVRRGDYVDNPFYVDLFKDGYYERAMAQFPNASFMVFSDDTEWCKQQPIFENCLFSEGRTEVEDMNRMAGCKGHIIANSSFSWWAAWLSQKKTVAPKQWYSDPENKSTKLLDSWIQL